MKYYELDPENNHFTDVVIDVTHRCNMMCKNCYIPNREIPDMDADLMIDALSRFPKKVTVRIIGAEPTMRKDLPELITRIKKTNHRITLLTNGLKLARESYVEQLKNAGLKNLYLSMNGVDNDDWYEKIDELRCANKKMKAMVYSHKHKILRDIGCIITQGVNEDAPSRMLSMLKHHNIGNVTLRFKTIGQIGRFMPEEYQMTMDDLINIMSNQLNLSKDYVEHWRDNWIYPDNRQEKDSFLFPLNPDSKRVYSGIWIKLVNWNKYGKETVLSNSTRRGRLTENFKVAPFFEHVTQNEGEY
tara:strand:- start:3175 stop:4077 length:903 start_codon:yes stop_codon:yes gene_type:complete